MKLKKWNGRGYFKYGNQQLYVAARSMSQCAKIVSMACTETQNENIISYYEIKNYYSDTWGDSMERINIEDIKYPSVWVQKGYSDIPKLIFELKI